MNQTATKAEIVEAVQVVLEGPILLPVEVAASTNATNALALPDGMNLPRLITNGGEQATLRFINYFTAEIENDNTRVAYLRAVRQFDAGAKFDAWCEKRNIGLSQLQPFVVAAYLKELKETKHPQTIKQHLAHYACCLTTWS